MKQVFFSVEADYWNEANIIASYTYIHINYVKRIHLS